jgi:hypothetical protein
MQSITVRSSSGWREAVGRHLRPFPGMTVADIGAGTGVFATAFLTEEEFLRGKERLRRAAQDAEESPGPAPRTNWLDLLVLR